MSINNNNIKSPKPRWFDGILYSNSPSPDIDITKPTTPTRQSNTITGMNLSPFSSRPPTHSPLFRSSLTDVVSESEAGVQRNMNMSPLSDVSVEQERERDVQSIQFDDDISYLLDVKLCDTTMFTPSIQYGKVIHILSGSELLLAARIYNGYTKVLGPRLYCFRIRLRDVSWFGVYEDMAKEELKRLILDKIVLLTHTNMVTDGFVDAKVYLLHMNHLKNYLKYGRMMNITNGDGNLYVNETINNYIRLQS